jgi:hypothetical protein
MVNRLVAHRRLFAFVGDERLADLALYWMSLRRNRMAPERTQLDPARFRLLLPFVFLCEREAPLRFWFRLAGEEINEL